MSRVLITLLCLLAMGCGEPAGAPRDLKAFTELSRANLARATPKELTGLDPVKEWALLLWVERSAAAADRAPEDAPLFLNGIGAIVPAEAAELARHPGTRIFLPDLKALDEKTASTLASPRRHELYLDGLTTLDPKAARALVAARPRSLSFAKVGALDAQTAAELAALDGTLRLDGVERISPDVARALARWSGSGEHVVLSLGLAVLDATVARELSACRGWGLSLGGIASLGPDAARELGRLESPSLALDGIRSLPRETAEVVGTWNRKFLTLDGLTSIDPEVRALVEKGCQATSFRSLGGPPVAR